jgi:hypothetical protein
MRAQTTVKLAAAITAVSLLILISSRGFFRGRISPESGGRAANGIEVVLSPSTLLVEERRQFQLKAVTDVGPSCGQVDVKVPDLQWERSFTRAELMNGAQAELKPSRIGTFQMQFFCNGRMLGENRLSVTIGSELGQKTARNMRWVLTAERPIYRQDSFFEVPILVSAEEERGTTFVPRILNRDFHFRLQDRNGQLAKAVDLLIQRNSAISDPVYLPFQMDTDYRLVAFAADGGPASNEMRLSWKEQAPKLSLTSFPENLSLYPAAISSAEIQVYLAQDGRRIKPAETINVLLSTSPRFKAVPQDRVELSAKEPVGKCTISAATTTGTWPVEFREPSIGLTAKTGVEVLSTRWFWLAAAVAGLIGVIVARQAALFGQKVWKAILELVCAAAAALLLYGMVIEGWIKSPGTPEFMLSCAGAALIGLVGGYMGLGVFKLAEKLF